MTLTVGAIKNAVVVGVTGTVSMGAVTAGSSISLWATYDGNGPVPTIVDTLNGAWGAPNQNILDTTNAETTVQYLFKNSAAGTMTITVTFSTGANADASAVEVLGAKSAYTSQNAGNYQNNPATTPNTVTSGNVTPTAVPFVIVALSNEKSANTPPNAGTGFTSLGTVFPNSANSARAEYKIVNAGLAALAGTFTATSAGLSYATLAQTIYGPALATGEGFFRAGAVH